MVELRWREHREEGGEIPVNAIPLRPGFFAVLEYRQKSAFVFGFGIAEIDSAEEWKPVPFEWAQ